MMGKSFIANRISVVHSVKYALCTKPIGIAISDFPIEIGAPLIQPENQKTLIFVRPADQIYTVHLGPEHLYSLYILDFRCSLTVGLERAPPF